MLFLLMPSFYFFRICLMHSCRTLGTNWWFYWILTNNYDFLSVITGVSDVVLLVCGKIGFTCYEGTRLLRMMWAGGLDFPSKLKDLDFNTMWLFDFYFTKFYISTPNFLHIIFILRFLYLCILTDYN